jgi:hypothetical protein
MGTVFAYSYTKSNNIRPGLLLLAFTVFFSILSCASVAFGQVDVSLAWDASSGADGYRLFYREDGHIYMIPMKRLGNLQMSTTHLYSIPLAPRA